MTAALSITCLCGRTASTPCPTVADIPDTLRQFAGWAFDERGFVRCDECIAAGAVIERMPEPVSADDPQLGLFGSMTIPALSCGGAG